MRRSRSGRSFENARKRGTSHFAAKLGETLTVSTRARDVRDTVSSKAREVGDVVTERARDAADAVDAGRVAARQAKAELERAVEETRRAYSDARRSSRVADDLAGGPDAGPADNVGPA